MVDYEVVQLLVDEVADGAAEGAGDGEGASADEARGPRVSYSRMVRTNPQPLSAAAGVRQAMK